MKISLKWLQTYFEAPLPSAEEISDALTFHAFEIESAMGDLIDVKVLPNRAADCLSHRGIAKELSAILDVPVKYDPLREALPEFSVSKALRVEVEDAKLTPRYMAALVRGVKVAPSPSWLKESLEAVGQRSINNVVDITNFVMLNTGQPLHAFDAGKMQEKEGYAIAVRGAKAGEKITTLTGENYELPEGALLITDGNANAPVGIAGIKGGKSAEVSQETTDIILESANFDGPTTRRTAQRIKLFTEASQRFQNRPSPELAAYGMRDALALLQEVAGGEVEGVVDAYPAAHSSAPVSVSLSRINGILGAQYSSADVESVFKRLGLPTEVGGETFTVMPPLERTDLTIPEDLVEEVGRIMGYEKISPAELPEGVVADQARFRGVERMKDQMVEQGFIEVSTQSFAKKGDVILANPMDKEKPALRTSLESNLQEALTKAKQYAPLVLAPNQKPKLFEVGTVFPKDGEYVELRMTETAWGGVPTHDNLSVAKLEEYGKDYEPKRYELGAYKPYSAYPFVVRDIAVLVPKGTMFSTVSSEMGEVLRKESHGLWLNVSGEGPSLFDQYALPNSDKVSFAYRIIFNSMERTLTDDDVNGVMEKIYVALKEKGYEIR